MPQQSIHCITCQHFYIGPQKTRNDTIVCRYIHCAVVHGLTVVIYCPPRGSDSAWSTGQRQFSNNSARRASVRVRGTGQYQCKMHFVNLRIWPNALRDRPILPNVHLTKCATPLTNAHIKCMWSAFGQMCMACGQLRIFGLTRNRFGQSRCAIDQQLS